MAWSVHGLRRKRGPTRSGLESSVRAGRDGDKATRARSPRGARGGPLPGTILSLGPDDRNPRRGMSIGARDRRPDLDPFAIPMAVLLDGWRALRFGRPVVVVSGVPRSGTSMAMKMLAEVVSSDDRVSYCLGDAQALPLRAGSVGMVFVSNVVHHLADLPKAAEGFAHVLEPGGFAVVRNYVREQLQDVPYLEFFPEAHAASVAALASGREIGDAFRRAGFSLFSHRSIRQPAAASPLDYLSKVQSRVYSDLAAISDAAFVEGNPWRQIGSNAGGQIVDHHDLVPSIKKSVNGMTADIASTAGNQDTTHVRLGRLRSQRPSALQQNAKELPPPGMKKAGAAHRGNDRRTAE